MSAEVNQLDWLIIVLIYNHQYYDDLNKGIDGYVTMETQRNHIFNAFEDIQFSENIKYVLVENKLSFVNVRNDELRLHEEVTIIEKTEAPKLSTGIRNSSQPEALTNEKTAAKILQSIISANPSKKHILITFGHGSIFGINFIVAPDSLQPKVNATVTAKATKDHITTSTRKLLTDTNEKATNTQRVTTLFYTKDYRIKSLNQNFTVGLKKLLNVNQDRIIDGGPARSVTKTLQDINKMVILTNKELASVIKKVLGKDRKLDILVMYNCLMQNLYTQYELRNQVEYLVAPITGISHPGYNYSGIFKDMRKNFYESTEAVANLFIETIRDNGDFYTEFKDVIEKTWKICSVNLDAAQYKKIKAGFRAFTTEINELRKNGAPVFMCLNNTLNQCFNYAGACLNNDQTQIDLLIFLQYLSKKIETGFNSLVTLKQRADKLIELLSAVKSNSFIGESFFPNDVTFADESFGTKSGFGFVFQKTPYQKNTIQLEAYANETNQYFPGFLKNTGFIEMYKEFSKYNDPDND